MKISVPEHILSIKPYKPGKPIEEVEREYGIEHSIKLASNENPLGPSPMAVKAIQKALSKLNRYPDGGGHDLIRNISKHQGVMPENVVLGNGSDEIIGMLTCALLQPGNEAILPRPSFLMYDILVRSAGARPVPVELASLSIDLDGIRNSITPDTRMIFLCNPNNPTGTIFTQKEFETFLESIPKEVVVVVDEAYIEFVRDADCANSVDSINSDPPVVTLRTFSKVYGLAGLRIGYGVMSEDIASILNRIRLPFNASSLAQAGANAALKDEAFLKKTRQLITEELNFLWKELKGLGIRFFPTQANFFLIDTGKNADEVFENMLRQGVIVRSMTSYGYPEYIRINAGLHDENVRFLEALEKVIS
jgi:histidinol-phosphate aminotransferase